MNCSQLVSRVYQGLDDNQVFWEPDEMVECLNEASCLLVLLKPGLLPKRVLLDAITDQTFFDLRDYAPDLLFCDGVTVGDTRTDVPVPSQDILRHLRKASVGGFRTSRAWLSGSRREAAPRYYARFGMYWLITAPRAVQAHTLTLMYRAMPVRLVLDQPNVSPDLPEPYHAVIAEVATILAQAKEGSGTIAECSEGLARIFGREPLQALTKAVGQAERRATYMANQGAA
jgi:hypothetical protein